MGALDGQRGTPHEMASEDGVVSEDDGVDLNATGMSAFSVVASIHEVEDEEGWLECGVGPLDEDMALRKLRKDMAQLVDLDKILDEDNDEGLGEQDILKGGQEMQRHVSEWATKMAKFVEERKRLGLVNKTLLQDLAKIESDKLDIIMQAMRLLGLDILAINVHEMDETNCRVEKEYLNGGPWMEVSTSIEKLAAGPLMAIKAVIAGQPLPQVMDAMQKLMRTTAEKNAAIDSMDARLRTARETGQEQVDCLQEQEASQQGLHETTHARLGGSYEELPAALRAAKKELRRQQQAHRQERQVSERFPFNAGYLFLNHSDNPGVNSVSKRGANGKRPWQELQRAFDVQRSQLIKQCEVSTRKAQVEMNAKQHEMSRERTRSTITNADVLMTAVTQSSEKVMEALNFNNRKTGSLYARTLVRGVARVLGAEYCVWFVRGPAPPQQAGSPTVATSKSPWIPRRGSNRRAISWLNSSLRWWRAAAPCKSRTSCSARRGCGPRWWRKRRRAHHRSSRQRRASPSSRRRSCGSRSAPPEARPRRRR